MAQPMPLHECFQNLLDMKLPYDKLRPFLIDRRIPVGERLKMISNTMQQHQFHHQRKAELLALALETMQEGCDGLDKKSEKKIPPAADDGMADHSKAYIVICRFCGGKGHWSLKCPKRNAASEHPTPTMPQDPPLPNAPDPGSPRGCLYHPSPPLQVGEVATPPNGVNEVATPPNGVNEVATPPNGVNEVATPPNVVNEVATPPNVVNEVATPPRIATVDPTTRKPSPQIQALDVPDWMFDHSKLPQVRKF